MDTNTESEDIIPVFKNTMEEAYWNQLSHDQKIGIRVALKIIPNVYCMERTQGYQKWLQSQGQMK